MDQLVGISHLQADDPPERSNDIRALVCQLALPLGRNKTARTLIDTSKNNPVEFVSQSADIFEVTLVIYRTEVSEKFWIRDHIAGHRQISRLSEIAKMIGDIIGIDLLLFDERDAAEVARFQPGKKAG